MQHRLKFALHFVHGKSCSVDHIFRRKVQVAAGRCVPLRSLGILCFNVEHAIFMVYTVYLIYNYIMHILFLIIYNELIIYIMYDGLYI